MEKIICILILLLAFFIRIVGLVPGHNPNHPDEPMSYSSALEMFENNDLNPRRFDYPAGVPLLHYALYKTFILPVVFFSQYALHPRALVSMMIHSDTFIREHTNAIFGKSGIHALFWSRAITALLGVASVYLVYVVGKKLHNPVTGIAASFFLAVNYRHVLSSHLALSDIPNSFFALLAFWACLLLLEKNTRSRYLLCGFFIGLSVSMKYQLFAFAPFLLAHLVWVGRKRTMASLINKRLLISVLTASLLVLVLNFYHILYWEKTLAMAELVSRRYGSGAMRLNVYPLFYLYHWGIGNWPSLAIAVGFLFSLMIRPLQTIFLLSYVGPFLFVFLYYLTGGTYIRNFTTVIPFLMVFAGYGVSRLHQFFQNVVTKRFAPVITMALVLGLNAHALKNSVILDIAYAKPWNRSVLTSWASSHLPVNSRVLNGNVGLPSALPQELTIVQWVHKEVNSLAEIIDEGYEFAVFNADFYQNYLFWFTIPYKGFFHSSSILPVDSKDSYYGVAVLELMNYAVYEHYKPWQAPDNNYVVIKTPRFKDFKSPPMAVYGFDTDTQGWLSSNGRQNERKPIANDTTMGHQKSGSLAFTMTGSDLDRVVSPMILIQPAAWYTATGGVFVPEAVPRGERDAFLRVDFYASDKRDASTNVPLASAVSARVNGSAGWHTVHVTARTPDEARFLTVSLQRSLPQKNYRLWLDDVSVSETVPPEEIFPQLPYIKSTIPRDVIFPISIY